MALDLLFLFLGLVTLILGGDFLVRGASSIALKASISPLVVGLTIVAFGTSAPELFISVNSALAGSPDLTMGNVIGSNICNLALVLGVTAIISPITVQSSSIKNKSQPPNSNLHFFFRNGSNLMKHLLGLCPFRLTLLAL